MHDITLVKLELSYLDALETIAAAEGRKVTDLVREIVEANEGRSPTSALRIFVLNYFRAAGTAPEDRAVH
jgi:predicted DNA-binding ribbon-helix-helix protein